MDRLGIAEMRDHLVRVERCGHHQEPQVVAQGARHLERQREAEVAGERPLVEFIKNDEADVGELGIGEEALRQQAAQLPSVILDRSVQLIGKNTMDSISSGVLYGAASMVDGMIQRLREQLGEKNVVIK